MPLPNKSVKMRRGYVFAASALLEVKFVHTAGREDLEKQTGE